MPYNWSDSSLLPSMYARLNASGRGIIEGLRFGALVGFVLVSLVVVWNYVTQPISAVLGVAEAFEYVVGATICGAIIDAVYGPPVAR
jgi:uncharacterized membrane protein